MPLSSIGINNKWSNERIITELKTLKEQGIKFDDDAFDKMKDHLSFHMNCYELGESSILNQDTFDAMYELDAYYGGSSYALMPHQKTGKYYYLSGMIRECFIEISKKDQSILTKENIQYLMERMRKVDKDYRLTWASDVHAHFTTKSNLTKDDFLLPSCNERKREINTRINALGFQNGAFLPASACINKLYLIQGAPEVKADHRDYLRVLDVIEKLLPESRDMQPTEKALEELNALKEILSNIDLNNASNHIKYILGGRWRFKIHLNRELRNNDNLRAVFESKLSIDTLSGIQTQEEFNKAILGRCNPDLLNQLGTNYGSLPILNNPIRDHAKSLHTKLTALIKDNPEIQADPREFVHVITVINNALEKPTKESIEELKALGKDLSSKDIWKTIGITMMVLGAAIAIAAGIALTIGSVGIATPLGIRIAVVGGFGVASALAGGLGFFAGSNNKEGMAGLSADIDNLQQSLTTQNRM